MFYQMISINNEDIGVVWGDVDGGVRVFRVYLPDRALPLTPKIFQDYPDVNKVKRQMPGGVADVLAGLYGGRAMTPDRSCLNWKGLSDFSVRVLRATCLIPRGRVMTYGQLARAIGSPQASRAVGTALAQNPFPILVPCHRVVRAGGYIGQFGGGSDMKREMLEKEGISVDLSQRVPAAVLSETARGS